ncbi:hypothetical protein NZD85_04965 [Empedobacter stercoris]|uniref:hypothetical protein n=1 Tax=Empedobacter stercoris TaxID=1628248 RepID=UPI0021B042C2|nr:hypothetical protein [Empedobacter stercoris]UWX67958.1 hypothetical protein NZD85_04965 [Empedobacter stercoris]
MTTKNKPHDTYVLGLNTENKIVFFKTYNYETEKDEAQKDLEHIRQQGLTWEIGELKDKIQYLLNINKKWNDLDDKIGRCYPDTLEVDEDNLTDEDDLSYYENADLTTIGELAAIAFGYL